MQFIVPIILGLIVVIILGTIIAKYKQILAGFAATRQFYHEVMAEMKNVAWPSKDEVIASTVLVCITTVILVVMIGAVDSVLGHLVGLIFKAD